MRSRWALALAALLATVSLAACEGDSAPPIDRLVIAGGPPGSVYDDLARAFADVIRARWGTAVTVATTDGSVENLNQLSSGKADVGFSTVDVASLALQGQPPFGPPRRIVALAGLYEDYVHIVVPAASQIEQISDLDGLPVSLGAENSGTPIIAQRVLDAAGKDLADIKPRYLSPADSATALLTGEIKAFFMVGGLPTQTLVDLAKRVPVRLLPIDEELDELQSRHGEYYHGRSIPPNTYNLTSRSKDRKEIKTVGVPNVLVSERRLSEDVAYRLTELLFMARTELANAYVGARRLEARSALAVFPLHLHPGAANYYRESKPLSLRIVASSAGRLTIGQCQVGSSS
jgi:uncharacterized protein